MEELDETPEPFLEALQGVLNDYSEVFETPKGLPPRPCDHQIPLQNPTLAANVWPYQYPFHQKNKIETQVQEMLASGIIQPNTSSFASPVVLVQKADGTWRLCVDYRALNRNTIKDKFSIPLIDDLLEELHQVKFFSKLDLRSGYHQIRVAKEDVHKTAFRTHKSHYEFLVMPFGLTNAPSTFQGIMNHIFAPYLQRYVIFF